MTYKTRAEYEAMMNTIIDEETGMTALDWWEITHPDEELVILDEDEDLEEDWDEPWALEVGFDPYEGCYTYDC